MLEQNKKDKTKLLIVGLFCFVLIISILGYTYAFFGLDDKTSSIVGAEAECYTVNYTKGQDISGKLTSGIDYTGGSSTDILMYTKPDCGLMYGTLYLTTNKSSTINFESEALRYTVLENDKIVSEGIVEGIDNQEIYTNFTLKNVETTYKVYIWLDETKESDVEIGTTFSGFIHADAILSSNFTSYVLETSDKISSEDDPYLSTSIKREEIYSINFIDTDQINEYIDINNDEIIRLEGVDEKSEIGIPWFDVSQAKNDSVKLYYKYHKTEDGNYYTDEQGNRLYDIIIGTDTGTTIAGSGYHLFSYLTQMKNINLENLDTTMVTTMQAMFASSIGLEELDLSNFNVSNVTNMKGMFAGKTNYVMNLTSIIFSEKFDTSNVTDMGAMFQRNEELQSLDLSGFDVSNVEDMSYMFNNCKKLHDLDLSDLDTSNVKNMSYMFYNCSGIISLKLLGEFDTSSVEDMSYMFYNCSKLTSLDLSDLDTSNVKTMQGMFYNCTSITSLNLLGEFDTSNVTNMKSMFAYNKRLENLDLSNFDTSSVEDMSYMFNNCIKLQTINLGDKFNTSSVKTMQYMFGVCSVLKEIIGLEKFSTSEVTTMREMFTHCKALEILNLSSFDTQKVTDMVAMFENNENITTIYVSEKFKTNSANGTRMFNGCSKLVGGSGTSYNETHVNQLYAKIDGGEANPGYFTDIADKPV